MEAMNWGDFMFQKSPKPWVPTHWHERMTHLSFVAWKEVRYASAWKNDTSFVGGMKRHSWRISMKEWHIFRWWHEKKFVTHRHERITHLLFVAWKDIRYTWHERMTHLWFLAGRGHFGVLWFGEVIWFAPDGQTDGHTDEKMGVSFYIWDKPSDLR